MNGALDVLFHCLRGDYFIHRRRGMYLIAIEFVIESTTVADISSDLVAGLHRKSSLTSFWFVRCCTQRQGGSHGNEGVQATRLLAARRLMADHVSRIAGELSRGKHRLT